MKLYGKLAMTLILLVCIALSNCSNEMIMNNIQLNNNKKELEHFENSEIKLSSKENEIDDLKAMLENENKPININHNEQTISSDKTNTNPLGFSFKSTSDLKNDQPILRKTLDGRNCAKTFVQDGKTYNDCTKANLPTGMPTDKEWCYVDEEYANTGSKWAYCQPIMDYNRVRVYNYDQLRELTKTINILDHEINSNISPAQSTIDSANQVKIAQLELSNNINQLTIDTKALSLNLKKNVDVKTDIEKKENIVKELNLKIDTLSKEKSNDEKTNCDGMLLYEDYPQGDGLKVYYFDNESWLGNSIISKDENISFDWTNTSPIKEINSKNFSIIWEGFILPPYSGEYSFTLTADNGGVLFINEKVIISHNIGTITDNIKNKLISIISPSNETGKKIETYVSKSKPIRLLGNTYVKIKLAYFHSYHSTPFKDNSAFVKLQWESDEFTLRDIESTKFFSINTLPPLKVTDFDTDVSILRKMHEGDDFFKNSSRYIIQDIPFEFLGMTALKFKKRYQGDQISFHVNTRCVVYVGLLKHYPNFLPGDFNNSGYKFQLLQIDTISKPANKKLVAEKASTIEVFKKEFDEGLVKINLKKEGLNKHGVNLIIFFGFNSTVKKPVVCQGDELIPSLSTSQDFKSCTASSEKSGYKCNGAFSNRMIDEEGAIWASDNEGIGAWIKVNFNGFYEIIKFSFKNRMNPAERNSKIQLLFSTGQVMNINLSNSDKIENIKLEPIRVNWVKITITGVYGTLNNGGAFSFYGTKCNENSNRKLFLSEPEQNFYDPLFSTEEEGVVFLSCFDSLANSMKFDNLDLSIDKKLTINCSENCINYDVPVYGTNLYSEDSSICKSAFHSMKLSSNGGLVTMIIKAGTKHYKASNSNGVRSDGKFQSNISVMFEMYNPDDNIILKAGSKVDLKMDASDVKEELANGKPSLWQPAVIMSVIDTSNGKFVKLMLDGSKFIFIRKFKSNGLSISI